MITHEFDIAAHAKRQIHMMDGRITEDNRVVDLGDPPPLLASSKAAS
jgi:energy-coupling factor transporter ATP-binding protein EcfA2